jgi:hypothetical protein
MLMTPLFVSAGSLGEKVMSLKKSRSRNGGRFYRVLERLGLGEFRDTPDEKTALLEHVLWQEARERGIRMREFRPLGLPTESFIATFPDGKTIVFEGIPFPPSMPKSVWWIDTKSVLKKKLAKEGVPVPAGGSAATLAGAKKIFNRIRHPVIVKPYEGSGSRHTTIHITTEAELERACKIGKQISPSLIIEEELSGAVYRPTVVNGSLVATIRRDRPQVVGDGVHRVRDLVAEANKHPARQGPYFSPIKLRAAEEAELALQEKTPESIPRAGERVFIHPKINWGVGGTTADVTDEVHPDNKELFEKVAN